MSKKDFGPGLTKILKMMCESAEVDFNKVDFDDAEWYMKNEWTQEQQEEFKVKLLKEITDNPKEYEDVFPSRLPKKQRKTQIELFVLSYGWKTHYNLKH